MAVRVPVGGGIHAPELHSDSPEAIYAHTPGLKVVMPCTPRNAKGLLIARSSDPGSGDLLRAEARVSQLQGRSARRGLHGPDRPRRRSSTKAPIVTVITWGASVFQCLEALDHLPENVSVELIDLRTIYPIDIDTIAESVRKTGRRRDRARSPEDGGHGRRNQCADPGTLLPVSSKPRCSA